MHVPTDREVLNRRTPSFAEFVALVALMMGISAFGVDNTLPAFPAIGAHFAVTAPNELQLVVYVYMIGFALTQLAYGPAADIMGRRPAFLVGLGIFSIGCVMAAFASDFTALLVARFVQGIGAAAGRVLAITVVRDRFAGREMARIMSLTTMVFIAVPILAPAIGGVLVVLGGWQTIFHAMLAIAVAFGAWFVIRMPETLHPENRLAFSVRAIAAGFRQAATCRLAAGYGTALGLMFGSIMAYVGSSQQIFAGDVYGLGSLFPLVFGSVALMMGVAALTNSRLVRRYGMRRLSHLSMLAFLALSALQCGAAVAWSGRPPLLLFWAILGATHFVSSLSMPNFNALAMEPLGRIAGTASSLIGFYMTLLGSVVGALIGQRFDGTVTPLATGYLVLGLCVVAVVLLTERGRLFRSIERAG